jgi:hypothetical protein
MASRSKRGQERIGGDSGRQGGERKGREKEL